MQYIDRPIPLSVIKDMSGRIFGNLVKAVVDIEKNVMVIDASMHADEEAYLLKKGSQQDALWGINLYPDQTGDGFIEFDSMINVRPRQKNFSRSIDDKSIQKRIIDIVSTLIIR